jgi:hypothetical protein
MHLCVIFLCIFVYAKICCHGIVSKLIYKNSPNLSPFKLNIIISTSLNTLEPVQTGNLYTCPEPLQPLLTGADPLQTGPLSTGTDPVAAPLWTSPESNFFDPPKFLFTPHTITPYTVSSINSSPSEDSLDSFVTAKSYITADNNSINTDSDYVPTESTYDTQNPVLPLTLDELEKRTDVSTKADESKNIQDKNMVKDQSKRMKSPRKVNRGSIWHAGNKGMYL